MDNELALQLEIMKQEAKASHDLVMGIGSARVELLTAFPAEFHAKMKHIDNMLSIIQGHLIDEAFDSTATGRPVQQKLLNYLTERDKHVQNV